ncbi:MAG TPA: peptidoglycan editing factor PgeF [Acidobacteriaceae bacterium]|nr:peptidoglycan editing factor PgeF [Acidobacteriaceae bacterium]
MSTNTPGWKESPEAIAAVDSLFASVGLEHGRRATRAGTWAAGERIRQRRTSKSINPAVSTKKPRIAPGLIRPAGWDAYPWLRAGFSTREGGATTAFGYPGDLNLGWNVNDPSETVAANRKRFLEALVGPNPGQLVAVRQFHSPLIRIVGPEGGIPATAPLSTPEGRPVLRGDALITSRTDILLAILTADCVPVLIADTRRRVVAAFHAGWRGTLARIVERGIGTMRLQFGSRPKDLIAAIGPGIGACCYSVGEEVRFDFESQFAYAPSLFSEVYDSDPVKDKYPLLFLTARAPGHSNIGPQIHVDLIEANRRQLLDAGLSASKISIVGECTACTRLPNGQRRYFSHRDEHGYTGRMLSVIGIAEG